MAQDTATRLADDGRLDFHVTVSGIKEISWWILGYGDQAEVLEPAALRQLIERRCRELVKRYDSTGTESAAPRAGVKPVASKLALRKKAEEAVGKKTFPGALRRQSRCGTTYHATKARRGRRREGRGVNLAVR